MGRHGSAGPSASAQTTQHLDLGVKRRGRSAAAGAVTPQRLLRPSDQLATSFAARAVVRIALAAWIAGALASGAGPARANDEDASDFSNVAPVALRAGPDEPVCGEGETLATGAADPAIVAREASRGVQAFWCETYGRDGSVRRAGPYWDRHPGGGLRVRAGYVESRLEGPVEIFDEEGALWLRGVLQGGDWQGDLTLFHANGQPWFLAHFEAGRVEGPVELRHADGSLEARIEPEARAEAHAAR